MYIYIIDTVLLLVLLVGNSRHFCKRHFSVVTVFRDNYQIHAIVSTVWFRQDSYSLQEFSFYSLQH